MCVCVSRIISETAPMIFPKLGTKLGVKNVRNVARQLVLDFCPFFSQKNAHLCEKSRFGQFLAVFGALRKIRSEHFPLTLPEYAKKIVLKDRIVVSPGKIRYF